MASRKASAAGAEERRGRRGEVGGAGMGEAELEPQHMGAT